MNGSGSGRSAGCEELPSRLRRGAVFRSWDHVHGVLRKALCAEDGQLDTRLLLSFVESVVPAAPRRSVLRLVAGLCGFLEDEVAGLELRVRSLEAERVPERAERERAERELGKLAKVIDGASWPAGSGIVAVAFPVDGPQRAPREPDDRSNSRYLDPARLGRWVGYDSDAERAMITLVEEAGLRQLQQRIHAQADNIYLAVPDMIDCNHDSDSMYAMFSGCGGGDLCSDVAIEHYLTPSARAWLT
ncbi:hypothetical protein [Amycolatopsis sp. NPDC057786]|uniref:hypothetical protein n=1 Tax=Amycolatopsis sp. NPDC057786 TaxID=3346250 RepID=UPI00366B042F